jgi:hypothetical protein
MYARVALRDRGLVAATLAVRALDASLRGGLGYRVADARAVIRCRARCVR